MKDDVSAPSAASSPCKPEHVSVDVIEREVGRWNTDIALGWETGLRGKERRFGRLEERHPPDHLLESKNVARYKNWLLGFDKAKNYRERLLCREIHFLSENENGQIRGVYKGWAIRRGKVVIHLVKKFGCFGEVTFYYLQGKEIVRTVSCGI
jgi:hypothetical protein